MDPCLQVQLEWQKPPNDSGVDFGGGKLRRRYRGEGGGNRVETGTASTSVSEVMMIMNRYLIGVLFIAEV